MIFYVIYDLQGEGIKEGKENNPGNSNGAGFRQLSMKPSNLINQTPNNKGRDSQIIDLHDAVSIYLKI